MEKNFTYKFSHLHDGSQIVRNPNPDWIRSFKAWFDYELYGTIKSTMLYSVDNVSFPQTYFLVEQSLDLAQIIRTKMVKDCTPNSEALNWFNTAYNRYYLTKISFRASIKNRLRYYIFHPYHWWLELKKYRRTNLRIKLSDLLDMACFRYIKEGGSSDKFKHYMLT